MTERLFTLEQRARRRLGVLMMAFGLLVPSALLASAVNATYVNVPAVAVMVLGLLAVAAWGLRLAFEARECFEINVPSRTWVVTKKGVAGEPQPLDTLAPLTVSLDSGVSHVPIPVQQVGAMPQGSLHTRSRRRTPMYVIHPANRRDLAFLEFRTEDRARRKVEALARAWGVAAKSYGGDVRRADAMDAPLHERVSGDPLLSIPLTLEPQWGVHMQPLSPGYSFTFTRPSAIRFLSPGLNLVFVLIVAATMYQLRVIQDALPPASDLASRIVAIAVTPVLLFLLVNAVAGFVRARPIPLVVTPEGVTLGRTTLRFDQIEEVGWVLDVAITGDRKRIRIPGSWFPAEAGPILVREIKRTIAETAQLATARG